MPDSDHPLPFCTKFPCSYQQHAKRIETMLSEGLHNGEQWKPEAHFRYAELEKADQIEKLADKCADLILRKGQVSDV